ncbi:hypothetical protein CEXT_147941 [Caerostris extrusa]|uniref:Uncharacterized protein n=1 Tax=Caerostris extrusa TaxID=172846 RepID=A0AAV4Y9L7_CAEEX|nr:hypothetical protein CEXT_147941 [Caerostris extrusa]
MPNFKPSQVKSDEDQLQQRYTKDDCESVRHSRKSDVLTSVKNLRGLTTTRWNLTTSPELGHKDSEFEWRYFTLTELKTIF